MHWNTTKQLKVANHLYMYPHRLIQNNYINVKKPDVKQT